MGQPGRLTLTHPASWTEFNVGKLRRAAEIAGFPDVTMCPEPVAAAFQHARNHPVRVGDRICIYDLGGGTFDVCVVQKTVGGFEILGSPVGLDPLGGIDFDKVVIDRVKDELALLSLEADPEDAGFWRLGRDCVDAKEALSTDVDVTIPVAIGGLTTSLRLTRSEFESMIDEKLDETILHDAARPAVSRSDVRGPDGVCPGRRVVADSSGVREADPGLPLPDGAQHPSQARSRARRCAGRASGRQRSGRHRSGRHRAGMIRSPLRRRRLIQSTVHRGASPGP